MAKSKPIIHKPSKPAVPTRTTKLGLLIDLLKRKTGATIAEALKVTGWQAHSVRGAMSGALKKRRGLTIASAPDAKRGRVYRIVSGTKSI
ncbi:MAG: DUF3489 domain-containing protein [Rhodospirillaceae bacterium]|nr:DUF3489 domain-containing protein [Rhodospirillaceae bacterium]